MATKKATKKAKKSVKKKVVKSPVSAKDKRMLNDFFEDLRMVMAKHLDREYNCAHAYLEAMKAYAEISLEELDKEV